MTFKMSKELPQLLHGKVRSSISVDTDKIYPQLKLMSNNIELIKRKKIILFRILPDTIYEIKNEKIKLF